MTPTLLLLLTLACNTEAPPPPAPTPAQAQPKEPTDPAALAAAGKYEKALDLIEKKLSSKPEDDANWDLMEQVALRSGKAGEVVDRLSADQALGNRNERHFLLRGVLALAANRPADALAAARKLEGAAPGDAAWLATQAVLAGAAPPPELSPATLSLINAKRDAAAALSPEAEALPGWRVATLRAELKINRGDKAGATAEIAKMQGGALATAAAEVWKVRTAGTADATWALLEPAAKAAADGGNHAQAAALMSAALPAMAAGFKAGALADFNAGLIKTAKDAGNKSGAAALSVVQAEICLRAGRLLDARAAVADAILDESNKIAVAWSQVLVEVAFGNTRGADVAVASLSEPRKSAAQDLIRRLQGAPVALPSAGLSGAEAAQQALLGAGYGPDAGALYDAALAQAGDATDLKLWAALGKGRGRLPADLLSSDALKGEDQVRAWLTGEPAPGPIVGSHPSAAIWSALSGGGPVDNTTSPVAAWGRMRAALAGGDRSTAGTELSTLATAAPPWRVGPWAPLLVQDGPQVQEVARELDGIKGPEVLPAQVSLHGWSHRADHYRRLWQTGAAPFGPEANAEQRAAVWDAQARYRTSVLAYLAGGAFPAEELKALEAAERAAGLVNQAGPTLDALVTGLEGAALISLRGTTAGGEVLVVTAKKATVVGLDPKALEETRAWVTALASGDNQVKLGDRVREQLFDAVGDVLLGVQKYVYVGDGALSLLPVVALPEQKDGVRYLVAIRQVQFLPTFELVVSPPAVDNLPFDLDLLALCRSQDEADMFRRLFPKGKVLVGRDATVSAWRSDAAKARFIHIGTLDAAPGGGYQLSDGVLSLGEIVDTPLRTQAISVASDNVLLTDLRLRALRQAGAKELLGVGWVADKPFQEQVLGYFWETVNRRTAVPRSTFDALSRAMKDKELTLQRQPWLWGGYFPSGRF